jgi:hypothetical protein
LEYLAPGAQQQARQEDAGVQESELAVLRMHAADYKSFPRTAQGAMPLGKL